MNSKISRLPAMGFVLFGAIAGFFLRGWELSDPYNSWGFGLVCLVLAICALALVFMSRDLVKRSEYESCFSSGLLELLVSVAAALLLLIGNAMKLMQNPAGTNLLVCFLGIIATLCIAVTAAERYRGVKPMLALHIIPCLYLVVKLIFDFRIWSVDPDITDYCFNLFASISAMCATYHMGGFCFDEGNRQLTAFWCLVSVIFSAVASANATLVSVLLYGGMALWLFINAWQLLEEPEKVNRL